jgi:hypothetical protein
MRPEYVTIWLRTPDIEALGGERPIDVIVQGDISAVARVVSGLESPGAAYDRCGGYFRSPCAG